ncbi:hypothetical protein F9082_17875, partial [Escherichia coli]
LIMLPSETMIWQPEFTDKTLSRKPGAVHLYCLSVGLAALTLISVNAMRIPSLLVQALSNRKYHHLYQHMLVDVR